MTTHAGYVHVVDVWNYGLTGQTRGMFTSRAKATTPFSKLLLLSQYGLRLPEFLTNGDLIKKFLVDCPISCLSMTQFTVRLDQISGHNEPKSKIITDPALKAPSPTASTESTPAPVPEPEPIVEDEDEDDEDEDDEDEDDEEDDIHTGN